MACHPSDPGIGDGKTYRGVARPLGMPNGFKKFIDVVDSPFNGLNFCQGCMSEALENPSEEIFDVIRYFGERKKIFNVHKNFILDSCPVFRCAIESDMIEGRTKEIYIEEVDPATLQEMIHYIYTGKFTGADLNVEMVAWLADKYDLPGMMDLLCINMREVEDVGPETIADMLIRNIIKKVVNLKITLLVSPKLDECFLIHPGLYLCFYHLQ